MYGAIENLVKGDHRSGRVEIKDGMVLVHPEDNPLISILWSQVNSRICRAVWRSAPPSYEMSLEEKLTLPGKWDAVLYQFRCLTDPRVSVPTEVHERIVEETQLALSGQFVAFKEP
jgi:hypothetical protein